MAYVITQNCCKDASCVPVCPVDCIRPVAPPDGFTTTEMLYIDPEACIDCGACQEECPVDAIYYEDELPADLEPFRDLNARYFAQQPTEPAAIPEQPRHTDLSPSTLRVAVVGAGPAGCYAAAELLAVAGVDIDVYERLPTPYGLVRAGVAPDHQHTKAITKLFDQAFRNKRLTCHFNVEIGRDLSHEELAAHHHAVIYAIGASQGRLLGIPGEQLNGCHSAAEFVGWYNGHPDHAAREFTLSGERAVIIGNGNVALDIARVLLTPVENLRTTDITENALNALAQSAIREVVIVARRDARNAAFSVGEFLALGSLPGVDVVIENGNLEPHAGDDVETAVKLEIAREYAQQPQTPGHKRIVFRFLAPPAEIIGESCVEGLRVGPDDDVIATSLVLRSTGYRGSPVDGLSFDQVSGTIPNDRGRVVDADGRPQAGLYTTGWIKRGPSGVIGTNRACAEQTVARMWEDFDNGDLSGPLPARGEVDRLLGERGVTPLEWHDWGTIDAAERERGAEAARPRLKFVSIAEMVATARS